MYIFIISTYIILSYIASIFVLRNDYKTSNKFPNNKFPNDYDTIGMMYVFSPMWIIIPVVYFILYNIGKIILINNDE